MNCVVFAYKLFLHFISKVFNTQNTALVTVLVDIPYVVKRRIGGSSHA